MVSQGVSQIPGLSGGFGMESHSQPPPSGVADMLAELIAEKESIDPAYVHCSRLLEAEIERVQRGDNGGAAGPGGGGGVGGPGLAQLDPHMKQMEKVYIPFEDQKKFNLVGRLLGPKGLTLKRVQAETQTKMSILGRGSMRDRAKEEELRNGVDPTYAHLKDNLHVLIEANPPYSNSKLAAGLAEVQKMLIPPEPGAPDFDKFPGGMPPGGFDGFGGGPPGGPPRGGLRGRGRGGGGGRGMGRGRGGPRGGGPRGGGGRFNDRGPPRGRGGPRGGGGRGGDMGGRRYSGGGGGGYNQGGGGGYEESVSGGNVGYGDRPSSGGGGGGGDYGGSYSSEPAPSDQYYSSFSDAPDRGGGGAYGSSSGSSDWKSPRPSKRDYRHHPYGAPAPYY